MPRSRVLGWASLVAAITLLGGYALWHDGAGKHNEPTSDAAQVTAVPVKLATVRKGDFPIYLTGLGTVQGFNTVVVRTRVDGQIDRIAFKEGQLVEKDDLLALVDPRPYQAALDQAKAKKAQDEANLANAELDLQRYTKLGDFATRKQTDTQRSMVQQLNAQIAADEAAIANAHKPSLTTPASVRRLRVSLVSVLSIGATSSMPQPRPASSPSRRSSRSP